jgi:hypothetical protein
MRVSKKKPEREQRRGIPPAGNGGALDAGRDQEAVSRLAHSYWEARGCQGGSPEEDWFRAEQELSGKMAKAASN